MNEDKPEKIDQDCNVCGSAIEVGSMWSRCSNRDCVTRAHSDEPYESLPSLSTDATDEEIAKYWRTRSLCAEADGPTMDEIDEAIAEAYDKFNHSDTSDDRKRFEGQVQALLPFSTYAGFGDLAVSVGDVEV